MFCEILILHTAYNYFSCETYFERRVYVLLLYIFMLPINTLAAHVLWNQVGTTFSCYVLFLPNINKAGRPEFLCIVYWQSLCFNELRDLYFKIKNTHKLHQNKQLIISTWNLNLRFKRLKGLKALNCRFPNLMATGWMTSQSGDALRTRMWHLLKSAPNTHTYMIAVKNLLLILSRLLGLSSFF